MEEFLRRARVHVDSETPEVKAEPGIEHQFDKAPIPRSVTTEAPPLLRRATILPKPNGAMTPFHFIPSNHPSRQILDVRPNRTPEMLTSPDETTPCLMCPSASKIVCDRCSSVTYCTSDCSDADSKAHQTLCKTRAEYARRPSEAMRRAIYFPESSTESIRFTWVKFQEAWTEDNEQYQTALIGSYFNVAQKQRSSYYVTKNDVLCRPLTRIIRIIAANDESPFAQINASVAKHINQQHAHPWKGPLLAIALQGTASNLGLPLGDDVAIEDLRHVLDFLNTYYSTALSTDFDRYFGRTVSGVRINSSGDQESVELPDEFEAVRVPATHSVFQQPDSCTLPIADQIEIPIIYAKCPRRTDREAIQKNEQSGIRKSDWNSPFRDLKQSWLLSSQEDFAAATFARVCEDDMVAEYYLGSAILVRQDEKPLHVKHVEALWRYNKYLLEPKMTLASRTVASRSSADQAKQDKEMVETYLCKARFAQFYSDGQCFQKTAAERAVPSPYEMKKRMGSLKRKSSPNVSSPASPRSRSGNGHQTATRRLEVRRRLARWMSRNSARESNVVYGCLNMSSYRPE